MDHAAKMFSPFRFSLSVQYASGAQNMPTRGQLRRWVKVALQREANITLRIVDEPEGHELNRKYRGKDYATNVLTFVYEDVHPRHGGVEPFGAGGDAERLLPQSAGSTSNMSQPLPLSGDVVICAPVAEKEALEQRKDLLAHYAHLIIHAILHLQGYDHGRAADAAEMESRETAIMLKLGYADPYRG